MYPVLAKLAEPFVTRYLRIIPNDKDSKFKVMRAEIYGCFAEELPPYNGTLTLTYLRERGREGGLGRGEMKKSKRGERKVQISRAQPANFKTLLSSAVDL